MKGYTNKEGKKKKNEYIFFVCKFQEFQLYGFNKEQKYYCLNNANNIIQLDYVFKCALRDLNASLAPKI